MTVARATLILFLLIIAAPACARMPTGSGEAQVLVEVKGIDNGEFSPDRVYWYYPPAAGQTEEFSATCLNRGCTWWEVSGAAEGLIYVAASYQRPTTDPHCSFLAFDAAPVQIVRDERQRVILRMDIRTACE